VAAGASLHRWAPTLRRLIVATWPPQACKPPPCHSPRPRQACLCAPCIALQKPPTSDWTDKELVQLLSRASYHTIDKSRMMVCAVPAQLAAVQRCSLLN
jgi:hypothetical protein